MSLLQGRVHVLATHINVSWEQTIQSAASEGVEVMMEDKQKKCRCQKKFKMAAPFANKVKYLLLAVAGR